MKILKVYSFSPSALCPADVLLFSRAKAINHKVIKIATASNYAHAALYYGDGMILEAILGGVIRRSIIWDFYPTKDDLKVLRLKKEIQSHVEKDFAQKIIKKAELYINHPYSLSGALASVFRDIRIEDKGRFFCSHLIAESYAAAGLQITPAVPNEKVHPGLIERSNIFDPVEEAVQVVTMKKSASPRPGFSKEPYFLIESRKFQAIHRAVSERLEKEGISFRIDHPISQSGFLWLAILGISRGLIADKIDDAICRAVIDENLNELFAILAKDLSVFPGVAEQDFAEISRETNSNFIIGTMNLVEQSLIQLRINREIQSDNANFSKKQYNKFHGKYQSFFVFYQYYNSLTESTDSIISVTENTFENLKKMARVKGC
ncbi:MAG: YiiX/YebB-like N1pC/P60 family cysteine hydrolase [Methylocella sp.]